MTNITRVNITFDGSICYLQSSIYLADFTIIYNLYVHLANSTIICNSPITWLFSPLFAILLFQTVYFFLNAQRILLNTCIHFCYFQDLFVVFITKYTVVNHPYIFHIFIINFSYIKTYRNVKTKQKNNNKNIEICVLYNECKSQ